MQFRIDLMVPRIGTKRLIGHRRIPTTISTRTIAQDLLRDPLMFVQPRTWMQNAVSDCVHHRV
jgi:hypothetical protein